MKESSLHFVFLNTLWTAAAAISAMKQYRISSADINPYLYALKLTQFRPFG
jgi:hypothetical protein